MQNELKYQVRSREIVDLVSAMRSGRLTLSPYFQRNLVWRDAHKRDFIDTILRGYPFPQIFLARGPIDLESMQASQCVVDGQQRLNTIMEYIAGHLDANGVLFSELTPRQREDFIKYEVAVIDFDLDAGDPRLKDVFHRLNRTYYSLSAIEKIASEYSASEFLLVARVLCGEIVKEADANADEEFADVDVAEGEAYVNRFSRDPGVDEETWTWLKSHANGPYMWLLDFEPVFTKLEFDRKVPLMFTLNVMCTYLTGYYNRNDQVRKFLEERNAEFPEREEVIKAINAGADFIALMNLPDDSMWWNKANFFTMISELARGDYVNTLDAAEVSDRLVAFSTAVPADYALAAREAVGRKSQRELRAATFRRTVTGASAASE